ncbi:MAG: hypothetical protein JWQ90_4336 [Hydrocarboniphaga sp.]|uniref:OmpA family protein n=1 Tax=Hydrocarboniphaga sp. TaxID=2033016 RepID=UPI0026160927|nr:OmpA family protein [Hydrocarboniphaga sp.]MDB5971886.1 hypothetical protein [Hydrocarboniphaga sp.]
MQTRTKQFLKLSLLMSTAIGMLPLDARAQDDTVDPLYRDGAYAGILGTVTGFIGDGNRPTVGGGVDVLGGVRRGPVALEAGPTYTYASHTNLAGGYANVLIFPFGKMPGLYGLGGIGILDAITYAKAADPFVISTAQIGSGYMFPLEIAGYRMGLRAEGLFRWGRYNDGVTEQRPVDDPRTKPRPDVPYNYHDLILRIGLQIPLPLTSPTPPTPAPVEVVPATPPVDSDGDGVPDDIDQCPGTPPNTSVDAKGCPLPLPPPPCKSPEPGEKVLLSGCATGETIVLRGVNFEFDKARLTPNAQVILDAVGDELVAHPNIKVELSGHTDSKGSDSYNQKLSDARAKSVVEYLESKGIDASRMTAMGYGETQPIADNDTDEGREINRRVELEVTFSDAAVATSTGANDPVSVTVPPEPTPAPASAPDSVEAPPAN